MRLVVEQARCGDFAAADALDSERPHTAEVNWVGVPVLPISEKQKGSDPNGTKIRGVWDVFLGGVF